ncbi:MULTISPECIES: hypothetical protein [unclassified Rathayibacter]|uniref:hypothetical protein n=1 Tax=unclassified Rathayibacter TaxID=2609250 RepID=UPI000CE89515|nr:MULTISPECIES: hypothetical protein [unclassified Rathayibacter]PPF47540.1 hypothetical protein C5E14_09825 [Rathayibacter sp. AY1A1]PPG81460.1 hypothetical protein C5C29_15690 [Rathayibacter sp. AY1H2]PPH03123.1 hypothetical protein C5C32_00900 [Rathayibacter sp. AY1G9]
MTRRTLDDLLSRSDPATDDRAPGVRTALHSVIAETRERAPRRPARSRAWWLAAPVLLVPGLVLATSAGTDVRSVPDFTIPISYTTDSGAAVSCSIDYFNGEIDYREVTTSATDYLRAQDWSGVGQRIHDDAVAYTTDPAWLASDMNSDGPGLSEETIRWRAWITAADDHILDTIPEGVIVEGDGGLGGSTDCTGEL